MDAVEVVAVVGACAPERLRYAKRLAALTERVFIPATRLELSPDPVDEAAALAPWADLPAGVVIEFPAHAATEDLIGALARPDGYTRLIGVVCVLDAAHLFEDLRAGDYVARRRGPLQDLSVGYVARALLTVTQIEYASTVVLVNWARLDRTELSTLMALVHHLSPQARLRLHRGAVERPSLGEPYGQAQERAGWAAIVSDDFRPHMTDRRVGWMRYENPLPFHPARLMRVLEGRVEAGEFGTVIRSAGFCRLATRPAVIARWDHIGQMLAVTPTALDDQLDGEDELLALGQDLAVVGLDLRREELAAALDEAVLTGAELAAGPMTWRNFTDPFPVWQTASDASE